MEYVNGISSVGTYACKVLMLIFLLAFKMPILLVIPYIEVLP